MTNPAESTSTVWWNLPGRNHVRRAEVELRTVDILAAAFLIILSALEIIFQSNVHEWRVIVLKNFFAILSIVGVSWGIQKLSSGKVRAVSRIVMYLVIISFVYKEMGNLIHMIFPYWWDNRINEIELAVFSVYPTAWFQKFASRSLTELMMFGYVVYGPLLPVIAYFSYVKAHEEGLERYLTGLVLANFICYSCYFLLPVAGPSRALHLREGLSLDGYFFTAITEYIKANAHLNGGAFPSAHCAASTVMLAAMYRHGRKAFLFFLPLVTLIYVSTIYGWFHYVADVVFGIGVGFFAVWFAPILQASFDHWTLRVELSPRRVRRARPVREEVLVREGEDSLS